jgi:outer membrane protein assembly factor BamB
MASGAGYAAPVVAGGRLVYFHNEDGHERLECLDPETGKRHWEFAYPVKYRDRYGYAAGPRGSPVIDGDMVYAVGVTAMMHALELKTGKLLWKRNLAADFNIPQYFFGYGPTPVVWRDLVIANVGGKKGPEGVCVAAFDKKTGKTMWQYKDPWGASYASPVVGKIGGREVALVMAGGESKPPTGGLLVLDARSGERLARHPWRADKYESVNAMSPLVLDDRQVLISECYEKGATLLEFDGDFTVTTRWTNPDFRMHWMMPIARDGHVYGFSGRNPPDSEFMCVNLETGVTVWKNDMRWQQGRMIEGLFRASLLQSADRFYALGEDGIFVELGLTPDGPKTIRKTRLFTATEAWTLPVLSRGLLYVCQNKDDMRSDAKQRLICYDFRGRELPAQR